MKTINYVTDTHSLVWYFTGSSRLSKKALKIFEKTVREGSIIVPIVVLAEIMHISKKKRIKMSFTETVRRIEDSENFKIAPLDLDILNVADNIEHDFVQKGVRQVKYFATGCTKRGQASKILPPVVQKGSGK